jgi:hypothetical protein
VPSTPDEPDRAIVDGIARGPGQKPALTAQTTGTITIPNYVQKKAGQAASFHHMRVSCATFSSE